MFTSLACFGGLNCDEDPPANTAFNFPVSRDVTYTARNGGPSNIHFYMQGGQRSDSNRVTPASAGIFHTNPGTWDNEADFVQFNFEASNNLGNTAFGSISYSGQHLKQGRGINVLWDGTGQLKVTLQ